MARLNNIFTTIRTEGALLPPDLLQRISEGENIDGLTPESYHRPGEKLNEAINRSWNALQGAWANFKNAQERLPEGDLGTSITRERWLLPLFRELDYGRLQTATAVEIDGRSYPISHGWEHVPIHLVSYKIKLDERRKGVAGASSASPHSLLQIFLNRNDENLWGFLSNGYKLRILRDNLTMTRQAYVEFDLEAMMEGEVYSDFVLLWLLSHQSRLEGERPSDCWLEKWMKVAEEQGTRALDQLRDGVEEAITALGSGFIEHPANADLRDKLSDGRLNGQDYYRQLLRIVYRLLFLFVAEDRDLLLDPDADDNTRKQYINYYSTQRLRRMAETFKGTRHPDLFEALRLVMRLLNGDVLTPNPSPSGRGEQVSPPEGERFRGGALGLVPLGSFLFSDRAVADVIHCQISNQHLLNAIRALSMTYDDKAKVYRSVDYKNLGPEELGSVYESLLELHPQINVQARRFALATAGGNERKTTGSYYTPTSLINALLDSALDPVLDEATRVGEEAILDLKVCDPACGSGHFLIAAANRMAKALAVVRTGEEEPTPTAIQQAKRDIISHCIYGVDINPMAVELCKVNLWMEALEPGKPLNFLDHRIQVGNSLLGTTPKLMADGIPDDAFKPIEGDDKKVASDARKRNKQERKDRETGQRSMFELIEPPADYGYLTSAMHILDATPDDTLDGVRRKEQQYAELANDPEYVKARLLADAWCAAFVWEKRSPRTPPTPALPPQEEGSEVRVREMATKAMRDIARDLRQRQTPAEKIMWEALRKNRLAGLNFRRQHPVANTNYVVDFFCYSKKLVIELDGGIHERQQEADAQRQKSLEQLGYKVIRFPNKRIYAELENVLAEILAQAEQVSAPEGEKSLPMRGRDLERGTPPLPMTDLLYRRMEDDPLAENLQAVRETVVALTDRYGFFHWHVAFPDVFSVPDDVTQSENEQTGWNAGFDVVLGNPPWERIKIQEKEWFAERAPDIASAPNAAARRRLIAALEETDPYLLADFHDDKRKAEGESHFARVSARYPLCGRGDINTYPIFAETSRHIINGYGRVGMIVPSGIATDSTTQYFFQDLMNTQSLASLYDFENAQAIFVGVHRSYKFSLVTMTGIDKRAPKTKFIFFAHQVTDLNDKWRRFTLSADDIAMLNPNTGTMATFRSVKDAEITKAIYRRVPVLIREETKDNHWGISFLRMFDMSNDSDKFRTREELEAAQFTLEGNHFVHDNDRYLPLYEGRLGHQYNHRYAVQPSGEMREVTLQEVQNPNFLVEPQFFVIADNFDERTKRREVNCYTGLLGHRRVARDTDERTSIACIFPWQPASYGWILSMGPDVISLTILESLYNSFLFDYLLRNSLSQPSIPQGTFQQLAAIPPHTYTPALLDFIVPRVLELTYTAWDLQPFAQDVGYEGAPFVWDEERRFLMRCELDALYFHLYQIERDDVDYIMETFPLVKRKDIAATSDANGECGEYVTKNVILEMYDQMARLALTPAPSPKGRGEIDGSYQVPDVSQWQTWLRPPPADEAVAHEDTRETGG